MQKICALLAFALLLSTFQPGFAQKGGARRKPASGGAKPAQVFVYPQFKLKDGRVCRWLAEQMPLRVYVSRGGSLDEFPDEAMGASVVNVDNTSAWPDLVAKIISENPDSVKSLPVANGYSEQQFQAAIQGINMWKPFEQEGLFSFVYTDDPAEADIYVFWTHHFVNKMGLALFANDIRGYTSKYMLGPVKAVLAHPEQANFKPVVILLRTSETTDTPMPFGKLRAAAAHEFGHALGIDGHSPMATDLMSIYYGRGVLSGNDAATIRYLYRSPPDLIP